MVTTKNTTVRQHMRSIASKGGKALVKKRGKSYMSDLVNRRWAKTKKINNG